MAFGCSSKEEAGGPPQQFAVNVIVAPVEQRTVTKEIDLVGSLASNERVELKSEISGVINEILFEEGGTARKGQLLISLDDVKLKARLAESEANFSVARTNRDRNEILLKSNTISEQAYDQSIGEFDAAQANTELRRRELEDARIRAPFDGVIGLRRVSPGQYIQVGQVLTVLVNIDPIKANFDVPERYIGVLKTGQKISISVAAYTNRTFHGEVYFISPEVSETTRNVLVRAVIDNADGSLKPGMFGNLRLIVDVKHDALVIPETAVVVRADTTLVWTVDENNTAQIRIVKPGLRLDGAVEILEGLDELDRVITEGHQKLGPGFPVNPLGPEAGETE